MGSIAAGREEKFAPADQELREKGCERIILACTELSLIKRDYRLEPGFLDVLDVLARKAVLCCGRLKKEYETLIT